MKHRVPWFVMSAAMLVALHAGGRGPQATNEPAQVIEVTARKYEFNPAEIRVKKGARVQLKVRALDRTHGMQFSLYPEGANEKGAAGLRLANDQKNWKIEQNQERVVELVADRAGVYPFRCSVFCGFGHGRMKGRIIVEE